MRENPSSTPERVWYQPVLEAADENAENNVTNTRDLCTTPSKKGTLLAHSLKGLEELEGL
jgi:hypothetical protein